MTRGTIAFIDDEPRLCEAAADWLEASGFAVATFTDPQKALAAIDPAATDCVVTDLRMPGIEGRDVLRHLRAADPDLPVILLSGHGDVPVAVEVMREGAHDFIEKPYVAEHLVAAIDRAVELRRMRREVRAARWSEIASVRLESRLAGVSPAVAACREAVRVLADLPVDLLIRGEPGVGKEEIARAMHDFGRRARRPFVVIDCAPRPEQAFEAELLGHERGFVAGTTAVRVGKLEHANGGTVFFDGIERLSPALQARLLRVLQDRTIERIGSNAPRPVDIRVIAATHAEMGAEIAAGRFRADLYHRLTAIDLAVPPLRERREDIALLFTRFVEDAAERFGRPVPVLLDADLRLLEGQDWPGNAAELKAAAERHVLGLRLPVAAPIPEAGTLPERVARFEAEAIAEALRLHDGRSSEAAEMLGIPRRTLNEKIAKYGLRAD